MNNKIIKPLVLIVIFLVSTMGLSLLTDKNNVDLTSEMPEVTMPVIYLQSKDAVVNEMFGYKGEMDVLSIRDTITPLEENLLLPVTIQTHQTQVKGISYEVRSMDMQRLLERKEVPEFSTQNGLISTEFQIQNLLQEGEEYRLIITLNCEEDDIHYYTRIIKKENSYINESIEFALDFHNKTFDSSQSEQLAVYLEPSAEGDNTTLHKVTLHSSLSQVCWASFDGQVLQEPIPSIKEINSSYNVVTLSYVVVAKGANGESEFYNVEEYYRVRYSTLNQRMYLLDYERTMNEIFRGGGDEVKKTAIMLGIRDVDVNYMTNENATIIAFVQEGDLWCYNCNTNQLSLVYSFRSAEGIDERENNQSHDIRLVRVSETGSIDFAVYGYMNRGIHEGYTGIGIYHYDSMANTIQEELFVQSKESYEMLKETWGKLFYVSDAGNFYMLAEDILYKVHLENCQVEKMYTGLDDDNFAFSESGRYIAWRESENDGVLTVTDLDTESQWQVQVKEHEMLVPIGFVESDFVYGIIKKNEIINEGELPMYKVVIRDKEQVVEKEYEKSDCYVMGAYVEDSTVFLKRARRVGAVYVPIESDAIKSQEAEAAQSVQVDTSVTEKKQTQIKLMASQEFSAKTPQVLRPKEVVSEKENKIAMENTTQKGYYTVYVAGRIIMRTPSLTDAIQMADQKAGVVLEDDYCNVWQRGRVNTTIPGERVILMPAEHEQAGNATETCLMALLKGENISFDVSTMLEEKEPLKEILEQAMSSANAKVFDLTGCTVSQIMYYLDQGSIILAYGENQIPMLISGYDEHNIVIYNPITNTIYKKGQQDSEAYFMEAGNIFISYLKQGNTP